MKSVTAMNRHMWLAVFGIGLAVIALGTIGCLHLVMEKTNGEWAQTDIGCWSVSSNDDHTLNVIVTGWLGLSEPSARVDIISQDAFSVRLQGWYFTPRDMPMTIDGAIVVPVRLKAPLGNRLVEYPDGRPIPRATG